MRADVRNGTAAVELLRDDLRQHRAEFQSHAVDDTRQLTALSGRVGRLETDVGKAEDKLAVTGEHHVADVKKALDDAHAAWRYKVTTAVALALGLAGVLSRFWH